MHDRPPSPAAPPSPLARRLALAALAAGLSAAAVHNARRARRAERANPPVGRFIETDGVRLHLLDRGTGPALVLLHGNGSMIQDFLSSGLVDEAARRHRVIVFDRPGYGHSARPRNRLWTPAAQADLLAAALRGLGVRRAVVLGHSWAAAVAVAMADRHPGLVGGLVLAAGYYYPSARPDVIALSAPAVPVLGGVLRHTLSPAAGRLIWPRLMRRIFGPAPVPASFAAFPREMALRPSQLRASAEETAFMIPAAAAARDRYARLRVPVAIIAGDGDRILSTADQSARLHAEIAHSQFVCLPRTGHMVHHTATRAVMAAIDAVAEQAGRFPRPRRP